MSRYYINTVDNVARRAQIEQQAKQLDLPLQRFRHDGIAMHLQKVQVPKLAEIDGIGV